MLYDTTGYLLKKILNYFQRFFLNCTYKTTFVANFVWTSQNNVPMKAKSYTPLLALTMPTIYCYGEINTLSNKIGLQMVEILIFNDVTTWPFCYFIYALTYFSMKTSAVRSPTLLNKVPYWFLHNCCGQLLS